MQVNHYVGRFAPSPSGALHFGSLITALASYLQARSQQGQWLVRIEDLDPPREVAGAALSILSTLEHYGLYWDGDVVYQSQRQAAYLHVVNQLKKKGMCYYCNCTRQRIQQLGGLYDGHCRPLQLGSKNTAIRFYQSTPIYRFYDALQGDINIESAQAQEDFIIYRRDGLFSYNLAVVIDDAFQGVNEIVRGADLITSTCHQIALYRQLGKDVPNYVHLPIALDKNRLKLSKQNHSPPLPMSDPRPFLIKALTFLHQPLPENWRDLTLFSLLNWAIQHWQLERVPRTLAISLNR